MTEVLSQPAQPSGSPGNDLPQPKGLTVIAIGASTGGLEAIIQLTQALPARDELAFILVQHLNLTSASMMAALLAPHTTLAVCEASEGLPVTPDHFYVMPPGAYLSVSGGALRLTTPMARQGTRTPFDFLLHSLAQEYGARAGCIVLSGTGTDGTEGLRSIKAHGGIVTVQDPGQAGYDGMPRSAIETGMADFVLPLAGIPGAMSSHRIVAAGLEDGVATAAHPPETGTEGVAEILSLLRVDKGHDFAPYKSGNVEHRTAQRIALAGLRSTDMAGYVAKLRADSIERDALASDLLIHVTSFFRDRSVFDVLEREVIPELVGAHRTGQPLRVCCASGLPVAAWARKPTRWP